MIDAGASLLVEEEQALQRLLTQARLSSICTELLRTWPQIAAANVVIALLVGRAAWWLPAALWLLVMEFAQLLRRRQAARIQADPARDPIADMNAMVRHSALIGVIRATILVPALLSEGSETWFEIATIMIGLSAGAVATSGGEPRIFKAWSYPNTAMLSLGWLFQGAWEGPLFALLSLYQHRTLARYVAQLGDHGGKLLTNATQLEVQRDRVATANRALADMTESLRAERDRAAAADAAKTRVLASVSHDLRQPLFSLSLNATALADVSARSQDEYLHRIEEGLRRGLVQCRSLLDQLVDFSRLEAGIVQVELAAVDMRQLLGAMEPAFQVLAADKQLRWSLDCTQEVPLAWTDPTLLERLLGNLVLNAIKFTHEGVVGIRLRAGDSGNRVEIEVFDTGPGIPAQEQERVFEEFYQLDNPSRDRAKGLGLGLSIVRRVSSLVNAQVRLQSAVGRGSSFIVELPVAAQVAQGAASSTLVPQSPQQEVSHRVLVIDDEPNLLESLSTMLSLKGWQVQTAIDAASAVRHVERGWVPDVLLVDFRLGGGATGPDAIRDVRSAASSAVPSVLVTGDTAPHRIIEALATGLPVLHKPLDGNAIDKALRQVVTPG